MDNENEATSNDDYPQETEKATSDGAHVDTGRSVQQVQTWKPRRTAVLWADEHGAMSTFIHLH